MFSSEFITTFTGIAKLPDLNLLLGLALNAILKVELTLSSSEVSSLLINKISRADKFKSIFGNSSITSPVILSKRSSSNFSFNCAAILAFKPPVLNGIFVRSLSVLYSLKSKSPVLCK